MAETSPAIAELRRRVIVAMSDYLGMPMTSETKETLRRVIQNEIAKAVDEGLIVAGDVEWLTMK